MPRPLSSSSSSRHNSGTNVTDKKTGGAVSPNSKRSSIRWFVHPPSVAFHSGKSPSLSTTTKKGLKSSSTSTTTTATTSPSLLLEEKAEVVPQEEERAPAPIVKTTTMRRPWSLSLSLLSGGGDRGGAAGEQPRTPSPRQTGDTVEEVPVDEDSPMVLRLQQELEEAKEQIIALQRIKEMQEVEMKQWQQQHPQSPPGSISILLNHNNEKVNNYLTPTSTTDVTAEVESDVRQYDDDNSSSGASTTGSVVQELSSLLDQQQQEDTSVSLQQAARGATSDLLEETNHPITLEVLEQERNDEPAVIIDDDDEDDIDRAANYSLDPTFDNKFDQRFSIGRASTPNSMTVLPVWKDLAFENASGIVGNDDERHFDTAVLPPMEVTAIRDPKDNNNNTDQNSRLVPTGNVAQLLAIRLRDAEQRSSAYHQKLESAQDLVASLFRDLERARRTIQSLVTRNVSLSRNIKKLKLDQEDNMIPRGSLVKACVYITPVFVLCGGLEFFVSTILLVWMLVELEASWMEGDDDDDDEDDDENLTSEEEVLRKLQDKELFSSPIVEDMPIPKDIVLSNEEQEALRDEIASEAPPDYQ